MRTHQNRDLQERLTVFAVAILDLVEKLPNNVVGRHLGGQLIRSGTSPALNYSESLAAESRKDFIHKLKVCLKELKETQVCLDLIHRKPLLSPETVEPVLGECSQLVAIFVTSLKTAQNRGRA